MEVIKRYKQTAVGVIPEDWRVTSLDNVGEVIRGASPRPKGDKRYYGGNVPRLMVEDVTRDGKVVVPQVDFLTEEGAKKSRPCKKGTLTIVCSGTVGIPSFLGVDACIHDGFLALINIQKKYSVDYLYHQLVTLRKSFDNSATHGGIFTNLTTSGVKEFVVPFPPTLAEQEAIAEALSDADALIESLETLLTKKRQVKQGTMQELLTGKIRLPGFEKKHGYKQTEIGTIPSDWEVKLLPDVCRFRAGIAHEQYISDYGQFVCINVKFISTDGKVRKFSTENLCKAKRDDIIMVMSDLPNGKALAKTFVVDQDNMYAVNQSVCALTPYNDHSKYLSYVLNRNPYFLKFDDGINQTHLLKPVFQKCRLPLPSSKAEQTAIAEILSDMDAETRAVEEKLSKARGVKAGMMSALLGGKIRLV